MNSIIEVRFFDKHSPIVNGTRPSINLEDGNFMVRILLESDVRPKLKSQKDIYRKEAKSLNSFKQWIEIAGGALAEYQNANYGDNHDPSLCAKAAGELFTEIFEELRK